MKRFTFEDFYLDVYLPDTKTDNTPINLLYVLDGDAFSLPIAEAIKLQMRNSPKTKVDPTIVVGISYHENQSFSRERRFNDFTPKKQHKPLEDDIRKDFPEGGGIESFLEQLNRVHLFLLDKYSIKKEKVGFFGHSLGGLCVLESYIRNSLPFITDFIAVSPSLWWDQEEFFNRPLINQKFPKKNVAISVGEDEGDMVALAQKAYQSFKENDFANELSFYLAEEENHMSVVFQTMSRNLRWFCHGN